MTGFGQDPLRREGHSPYRWPLQCQGVGVTARVAILSLWPGHMPAACYRGYLAVSCVLPLWASAS